MAKTKNKWITGTKRDSSGNFTEYLSTPTDALNATVIPYDYTTSVFEAIKHIVVGLTGARGPTGVVGATGAYGGPPGVTGRIGATGIQGRTGVGVQGATGVIGATGVQGATGYGGPCGITGIQGITGASGITGIFGETGYQGTTGYQGLTGDPGLGATGLQGVTGITPQIYIYNPISRYSADNTAGSEVWIVSSSTAYTELDWTRSGTTLTLFRDAHGHDIGNRVIVRDTNVDYQTATIDSTTVNSFSLTTSPIDGTQGNAGAYTLGFTYQHTGFPSTGGVLSAPAGDHSDVQLISMRIRTGTRVGTTYDLVVPASATNGAGANTSLGDCYIPDFNVRTDNDLLTGVGATMTTNISGSYSTFRFGALGSTDSRFILVHF